jgi:transposase
MTGRLTENVKLAIIRYKNSNLPVERIRERIRLHHNVYVSRQGIYNLLKRWKLGRGLARKPRTVKPTSVKLKPLHIKFMNCWLARNNEMTTQVLQRKLYEVFGVRISCSLIRKRRRELGWKAVVSKTCQLISHKNKLVNHWPTCNIFNF